MGDIGNALIHEDSSQQWRFLTVNQYVSPVRGCSAKTVGIAHGEYRYTRSPFCYISTAITDALPLWHDFDLGCLRFEGERSAQSHGQAHLRPPLQSIHTDPPSPLPD